MCWGKTMEVIQAIQFAPIADYPQFIPEMATLSLTEWGDLFAAANIDREQFMAAMKQRTDANKIPLTLVAVADEQLLGYGSIKESEPGTRAGLTPWLAGMYVKQNLRGNGIGNTIVQALEQKARELGFAEIFLSTDKAEAFYHKMGWQTLEHIRSYGSRDVALMRKFLQ